MTDTLLQSSVLAIIQSNIPDTLKNYFSNEFFLIALTFGSYFLGKLLRRRTGWVVMNPILVAIVVVIAFLELTGVSYETYNEGGHMIEFWLRPAVVALGVPLYMQLEKIKKDFVPILISELAGCVAGVVSVVYIAKKMGASHEVILSLASKSVTTPIAMEVTKAVGGIPSLTAAVVVSVGRLQDHGICACAHSQGAGTVDGYRRPRPRHGNEHGCEQRSWCLCQPGTDAQWHFHRLAHSVNHSAYLLMGNCGRQVQPRTIFFLSHIGKTKRCRVFHIK